MHAFSNSLWLLHHTFVGVVIFLIISLLARYQVWYPVDLSYYTMTWFFDAECDLDYLVDDYDRIESSCLLHESSRSLSIDSFACYQQDPFNHQLSCKNCQNVCYLDIQPHFVFFSWAADFYCQVCSKQWFVCRYCPSGNTSRSPRCSIKSSAKNNFKIMTTIEDLDKHMKLKCHKKAMKKLEEQRHEQQQQRQQQEQHPQSQTTADDR